MAFQDNFKLTKTMLKSVKIIIVDDEHRLCQSLSSLLKAHGFEVESANSGSEAMEISKNNFFDLALIDLFLPDISGQDLMLKLQNEIRNITTIIMTGNASIDTAIAALRDGAYDYLRKPFETAELIQTITNALEKKKLAYENKKINKQLAVAQRDYKFLVENSPDVIYMLDPNGKFTFVNPSIKPLTGLDPDWVVGHHFSIVLDEALAESCQWIFNERRTGERARKWNEMELPTFDENGFKKNKKVYTELQSVGIYQDDRPSSTKYLGTHGVIRDITEKKRAATRKKRIKAQLQRAEKLEVVGTLAGGVAHDLNNLLSGILAYPELLLLDMPNDHPHREYIEKIKKSGEDAAQIVNDLLTLARRRVPADKIFNMDDIISDSLTGPEYLKLKSKHPNVNFNINLNASLKNMIGSPVHISKCIINLLTNAAEAMPQGGTITIMSQICYLDKENNPKQNMKAGHYIKLVVADNGVGMCNQEVQKIFDPFYSRKKMSYSGTGLGMTIVWSTTKDHKGHIDIQSAKGKGTAITIYYPATDKQKKYTPKPDIEELMGNGQSILIVDDILEQRMMAATMLKALGYSPISVSGKDETVDYLKEKSVDLVLLDMVLGTDVDGLDTYKEIKNLNPDQKVIIVSGQPKTERIKEALKLGVSQYIKKPYSLETMGKSLKKEL